MSKPITITKEKILDAAFEITRIEGIKSLSNRAIAKKLNSSIRPIYYQFKNSEELKNELNKKIEEYFYAYITKIPSSTEKEYMQTGLNYINFAKEENNLFKLMFMTNTQTTIDDYIKDDSENQAAFEKIVEKSTNLKGEKIKTFHFKMWIFTHGLAVLINSGTLSLTKNQVKELLTEEYRALMLKEREDKNERNWSKKSNKKIQRTNRSR